MDTSKLLEAIDRHFHKDFNVQVEGCSLMVLLETTLPFLEGEGRIKLETAHKIAIGWIIHTLADKDHETCAGIVTILCFKYHSSDAKKACALSDMLKECFECFNVYQSHKVRMN